MGRRSEIGNVKNQKSKFDNVESCIDQLWEDCFEFKLIGKHIVGYHLLWSTTANIVGSDEQKERIQKLIIENNYFVGGKKLHMLFQSIS